MLMRHSLRVISLLAVFTVAGCLPSPPPCARIKCDEGYECVEATGACRYVGFPPTDAGTRDGGTDAGAVCTPSCATGQVCDPVSKACVQCVTNADCACPTPVCASATQTCVAGSPTDGGTPVFAPGESCSDAPRLNIPNCGTTAQFTVDLAGFVDDEAGTCSTAAGKDAVFLIPIDQTYDVRVTVTPAMGSSAQPVPYLRLTPCATGEELVCRDALGGPAMVLAKSLPKGTYALVLDTYDSLSAGKVDVKVELQPPTGPANETCVRATPASLDGGIVIVDTSTADDDTAGTCNSAASSAEVVYSVTVSSLADFHAVTRGVGDAGVDPVIYLRESPCSSGAQLKCVDQLDTPEHLRARQLSPGTYYLFVETYGLSGAGPVELQTWLTAPTSGPGNDTCAAPRAITFAPGTSSVSFVAEPGEGEDDEAGSCNSERGSAELVYQLTLSAARNVTVTATPQNGQGDPVIFIRETACTRPTTADGGTVPDAGVQERACIDMGLGGAAETFSAALSAGTYFVFIEGYGTSGGGPMNVTISATP